jgi:hypothetical protein
MVMACKAMEEDRAKEITVLGKVATTDSMRSTTQDDNVEAKWVENWYDGLGYCEPNFQFHGAVGFIFLSLTTTS